jgi:hypothetical protein
LGRMDKQNQGRESRRVWPLGLMALVMMLTGSACALNPVGSPSQEGPQAADTTEDMLGVWQGTSLATCGMSLPNRCNAQQLITITLLPPGDNGKIGGYYKCAYGNMNCYNMNTTGKISYVSVNRSFLSVLVQMSDGTSCRYQGRNVDGAINGGYTCQSGGTQFEQGSWRAKRQY